MDGGARFRIPLKAWDGTLSFLDMLALSILIVLMGLPSEGITKLTF
jgi:hypothetical protein